MVTILLAGGGTGGHVFPMVAVGEALQALRADVRVVYVGTPRGIESRVVGATGAQLELLDVLPLRGHGLPGLVRGALRAAGVVPKARRLVQALAPRVVFSVGGYAAGPVALAAWSAGVPVTLLEPNAVPGFTNRLLAPLTRRIYVGFPEVAQSFRGRDVRWTGVPLRCRFAPVAPPPPRAAANLLVLGGSQGAKGLNDVLPAAVAECRARGCELRVMHQAGRGKDEQVRRRYQELGLEQLSEVRPFIDDVAGALADADVVVARSGASSVAELCAVGRPAILVPYPYAADDHQRHNAESLARAGGAICIPQPEATAARVAEALLSLASDPDLRRRMALQAAERGRPDAAREVAQDLVAIAEASPGDAGGKETLS